MPGKENGSGKRWKQTLITGRIKGIVSDTGGRTTLIIGETIGAETKDIVFATGCGKRYGTASIELSMFLQRWTRYHQVFSQ